MKIYTKLGDTGRSSTLNRTSLPKNSPVFELLGTLDELSAQLGLVKLAAPSGIDQIVEQLQRDLVSLSGEVAGAKKFADKAQVEKLEAAIDSMSAALPENDGFVLSGKSKAATLLDVARTVARRAERAAVATQTRGGITKELLSWLNRLSDLLFTLARLCDSTSDEKKSEPLFSTGLTSVGTALTCKKANALCIRARKIAREMGVSAVVAVSDSGGNLIALQREDEAFIASLDIAINKAYTSSTLKMPTSQLAVLAAPGGELYGIQNTNNNRIVIFGGGEPLIKNGTVVGALGVSGGSAEADTEIAHRAMEYFEKEM